MEEPKGILKELLGWIADYNVCRAAYTSKRALYGGNFT